MLEAEGAFVERRHLCGYSAGALRGLGALGGAGLGIASLLAVMHPLVLANFGATVGYSILAALVGGVAGLITFPILYVCVRRKHLRHAVPIVYVPALIVVIVLSKESIAYAIGGGVSALLLLCAVAKWVLPDICSRYAAWQCAYCAYDLRGHDFGSTCPECGTPALSDTAFRDLVVERAVVWRRVSNAMIALAAVILLIALLMWAPYARFHPQRIRNVVPGMTMQEVRDMIGKPHIAGTDVQGDTVWVYSEFAPSRRLLHDEFWYVRFQDGIVQERGQDYW